MPNSVEVETYLKSKDASALAASLQQLLKDKPFEAKSVLANLCSVIADTKSKLINNEELVELGNQLFDNVLGATGLEHETFRIVRNLWQVYSVRGDLQTAVNYYNKVNFDYEGFPSEEAESVFQGLLNMITCLFELREYIQAEVMLRKCHERRRKVKAPLLLVQYNYCCGQYYDFQRSFLTAAYRYYQACNIADSPLEAKNIQSMMSKAVDTCILSEAGAKKDFIMSQLVKDERAKECGNFYLLLKLHKVQYVKKEETDAFSKTLERHQKIWLDNGLDNVQTAILEHNIIVTSKYFRDIKISALSRRLKQDESATQKILQDMIEEDKIQLSIDHRAGIISFKSEDQILDQSREALVNFCSIMEKI